MLVVAATQRELDHAPGDTLVCGVGPVEAAAATARALAERRPDAVLHVGIAGARTLEPLTVVLGSVALYDDIAAEIRVVDSVAPDALLLERMRAVFPEAVVAPIGTSGAVGRGRNDVEAMEGFGVLRACELAAVPAVELRVIANSQDEPDRSNWKIAEAIDLLDALLDRLDVV